MSYQPPPGEPPDPDQPPPYGPPPRSEWGGYPQPGQAGEYGPYGQPGQAGEYGPYGPYGQHGAPPQHPGGAQPAMNVLAILSIIFAVVFAPAGIVLGYLAKRQIRATGEQGDQLATWGLVLGCVFTAIYLIGCCALGLLIWASSDGGSGSYQ